MQIILSTINCHTKKQLTIIRLISCFCFNGHSMESLSAINLYGHPVLAVLVFLPRSWIILDNLEFLAKILDFFICCQDLGFLRFLAKILAINFAKKSKKNQDLAKKSKIMPAEIREENPSCFYNYKLGYWYFSSYVKLRLILWLPFLHFADLTECISWLRSKFTTKAERNK